VRVKLLILCANNHGERKRSEKRIEEGSFCEGGIVGGVSGGGVSSQKCE
jgi:hypothetical protein